MSTDSLVKSPEIANFFSLKAEKRKKRFHASTLCRSRRFPFALLFVNNAKEQIIEGLFAFCARRPAFRLRKHYFFTSHMGSHALAALALELFTDAANLRGPPWCTIAKRTFLVIANNLFTRKKENKKVLVMGTMPCNYSYFITTQRGIS